MKYQDSKSLMEFADIPSILLVFFNNLGTVTTYSHRAIWKWSLGSCLLT